MVALALGKFWIRQAFQGSFLGSHQTVQIVVSRGLIFRNLKKKKKILSIFASFLITFMEAQIFKVPTIFTDITPLYMWGIYTLHYTFI